MLRLFQGGGLHPHQRPHLRPGRGRGRLDPLRGRLLREEGVPQPERPVLRGGGARGPGEGLDMPARVQGGKIEDREAPHRVLDDRGGARLRRPGGEHARCRRSSSPSSSDRVLERRRDELRRWGGSCTRPSFRSSASPTTTCGGGEQGRASPSSGARTSRRRRRGWSPSRGAHPSS